jgi:hypothetical protein
MGDQSQLMTGDQVPQTGSLTIVIGGSKSFSPGTSIQLISVAPLSPGKIQNKQVISKV